MAQTNTNIMGEAQSKRHKKTTLAQHLPTYLSSLTGNCQASSAYIIRCQQQHEMTVVNGLQCCRSSTVSLQGLLAKYRALGQSSNLIVVHTDRQIPIQHDIQGIARVTLSKYDSRCSSPQFGEVSEIKQKQK